MMKKLCKVAGCLIAIGLVLLLVGGLMGGFRAGFGILHIDRHGVHWGRNDSGSSHQIELSDSFHTLDVDVSFGDISLEKGDHFSAKIEWNGGEDDYIAAVSDGALSINSTAVSHYAELQNGAEITITVPEELVSAYLYTELGDIELEKLVFRDSVSLQTDLGDIEADDCTFSNTLDAHSNLGNVDLSGSLLCNVNAGSDMGDVDIQTTEKQSAYDCHAATDLGSITVNGRAVSGHEYRHGSGGYLLEATTDLGSISLKFNH